MDYGDWANDPYAMAEKAEARESKATPEMLKEIEQALLLDKQKTNQPIK